MLTVSVKRENNYVSDESGKLWSVGLKFFTAWFVVNLSYLTYFLVSLMSFVLGLVTMRNTVLDICVMMVRAMIFAAVHITALTRRTLYRDAVSRLIAGQLNRFEERSILKKRTRRGLWVFALSFVYISTLNLIEAGFSFGAPDFMFELVDRVTFGSSDVVGLRVCQFILLFDCLFYVAFHAANALLLILCALFVLTLVNRVKSYSGLIRQVPVLTAEVLRELHDEFQLLQSDIKNVDDMFSVLFFLWYFEALVSAFNGFQYFLKGGLGVFSPIYAAFNFFQTTVAILIETYAASAIPIELEISKSALLDSARRSSFDHLPLELYLLSKRMSGNKNGLTAAGFFLITRGICLSFVGFLVTYLLVLLSSKNSLHLNLGEIPPNLKGTGHPGKSS